MRPSTAESTEIAGVIMASPKNSAAPTMPSTRNGQLARGPARALGQRHQRERAALALVVGAQQQQRTYLTVTTMISDHRISDEHAEHDDARDWLHLRGGVPDGFAKRIEWRRADIAEDDADTPSVSPKAWRWLRPSWASVDVTLTVMTEKNASR